MVYIEAKSSIKTILSKAFIVTGFSDKRWCIGRFIWLGWSAEHHRCRFSIYCIIDKFNSYVNSNLYFRIKLLWYNGAQAAVPRAHLHLFCVPELSNYGSINWKLWSIHACKRSAKNTPSDTVTLFNSLIWTSESNKKVQYTK